MITIAAGVGEKDVACPGDAHLNSNKATFLIRMGVDEAEFNRLSSGSRRVSKQDSVRRNGEARSEKVITSRHVVLVWCLTLMYERVLEACDSRMDVSA
jgi:hypothetical protein